MNHGRAGINSHSRSLAGAHPDSQHVPRSFSQIFRRPLFGGEPELWGWGEVGHRKRWGWRCPVVTKVWVGGWLVMLRQVA